MLTNTCRRRDLGAHFSEGARQLWLVLLAADLRLRDINTRVQSRQAFYWIYGDKIPSEPARERLRTAYGIEPALWLTKVAEPFVLPSAA